MEYNLSKVKIKKTQFFSFKEIRMICIPMISVIFNSKTTIMKIRRRLNYVFIDKKEETLIISTMKELL